MADILFITPNMDGSIFSEHTGTLLLATILQKHGLQSKILKCVQFGDAEKDFPGFLENALGTICTHNPKIVSFYTRCDTYHICLRLAQCLKQRIPGVYIVLGGPHSDICARQTIEQLPEVDFICCGEGENTIYPLFSSLLRGQPDLTVPGLVYRVNGAAVQNPRPAMVDLDTLPQIDYTLFQGPKEFDSDSVFPVDVGRGCPFGCTYCSTKTFWGRKYRLKTPQRIVADIKDLHQRFGINQFRFEHDMFTMKRDQVMQTCTLLRELDFPIGWRCSARMDCIDEDLVDIMADSGLCGLYVGIETGSQRMQKKINKNLKLDTVMPMLRYVHSKGIQITASFIYGFPEETEEDISQTMAMIAQLEQLDNVTVQNHLCTFLPGTELAVRYRDKMTPAIVSSDVTGNYGLSQCHDLIEAHPELFQHLWEYHSELRSKLTYFPLFFKTWHSMQPVFQYISEKYAPERLIDMYYDFVDANLETLEQTETLGFSAKERALLANDQFLKRFYDDRNYDLISDIHRLQQQKTSKKLENGGTVSDYYCFSPLELHNGTDLNSLRRNICLVTHTKSPNGNVTMRVRSMKR